MPKPAQWYADDKFWKTLAPWMFTEKRWANAPAEVDQILNLLALPPQPTVLDLCCGPGRHSLELARRGAKVTGVDRTAAYVAEARKRARAARLKVEFVKQDMRRFCRPNAFDAVINMFTAFGYFENPAEDRRVLVNVNRSLKPGGTLRGAGPRSPAPRRFPRRPACGASPFRQRMPCLRQASRPRRTPGRC